MPKSNVNPFVETTEINLGFKKIKIPVASGVEVVIEFESLEAQTIKDAPALEAIAGLIAGLNLGPLAGSLVAGLIMAAKGEIGAKDRGNGVNFRIRAQLVPLPQQSVSVDSR